ncbi:MAG: thiamine pyrophosphate-binding protein [Candidatus Methylomirabilales bacterium]
MNGAGLLVRGLKQEGVECLFSLSGDHINPIYDACLDFHIRIIDTRHESAAALMADAWARATARLGVFVVTGGPGHTNALTGLATAFLQGCPVLAISGAPESFLKDRGAFQELDQLALVRPITKWAQVVTDPSRIPEAVATAFREARSGRPGPVHLTIPIDILSRDAGEVPPTPPQGAMPYSSPQAEPELIEKALLLLRQAERPIVIAGSGAWWSQAGPELERFVELTRVPLFTIGLSKGLVSDDHPLCYGYADPLLNAAAREFVQADVICILGKRMDYRLAFGGPCLFNTRARIIQVDIHPAEIGRDREVEVGIVADIRAFLAECLAQVGEPWPERSWLHHLHRVAQAWRTTLRAKEESSEIPIHPLRLCRQLREVLPPEATVAIDAGDFLQWARIALPARRPGRWLRLGPLGTLGAAIPFGVAAKLARPREPVVVVTGDGGFAYHGFELHTALRHGLPIVVVIGNDQAMGMEKQIQTALYGPDRVVGCELGLVHYEKVVEALGGHGEFVQDPAAIRPALLRAFAAGRPACVNVMIRGVPSPLAEVSIANKRALMQ